MKKLQYADEEYYLTSEYILKLASKASELFESSEPEEKRILLKMTLQNLQLDGRKARFEWIKPFDTIALHASRSAWLSSPHATRTVRAWIEDTISVLRLHSKLKLDSKNSSYRFAFNS